MTPRDFAPVFLAIALVGCDSDDDSAPSGGEGIPGRVNGAGSAIDAGGATLRGLLDIAVFDDVESG